LAKSPDNFQRIAGFKISGIAHDNVLYQSGVVITLYLALKLAQAPSRNQRGSGMGKRYLRASAGAALASRIEIFITVISFSGMT